MVQKFDLSAVGERIKRLRLDAKLSLRELASRADIAASFLSRVEAGKASPTIMTLGKMVEALGMDIGTFFAPVERSRELPLVYRQQDMRQLDQGDRFWRYAFPNSEQIAATLSYEEYQPETKLLETERHNTDVFGYVIEGALTLAVPERGQHVARAGDAFYIKHDLPHVAQNREKTVLKMVVVQLKPQ